MRALKISKVLSALIVGHITVERRGYKFSLEPCTVCGALVPCTVTLLRLQAAPLKSAA